MLVRFDEIWKDRMFCITDRTLTLLNFSDDYIAVKIFDGSINIPAALCSSATYWTQ